MLTLSMRLLPCALMGAKCEMDNLNLTMKDSTLTSTSKGSSPLPRLLASPLLPN